MRQIKRNSPLLRNPIGKTAEAMKSNRAEGLSLKQNMLWNSFGSLTYLGCQWLITILVVRLADGYDDAGTLSLAMSVYNMFSSLAIYRMYTYQVSDVNHENTVGEYFAFRVITCSIALVCIVGYSIVTCSPNALYAIVAYAIYKIASLLIDVLHGLDQQNRRMDLIGKSLTMQGIVSLTIFCAAQAITGQLALTLLLMTVGIIAIGLLYDLPRSKQCERKNNRAGTRKLPDFSHSLREKSGSFPISLRR